MNGIRGALISALARTGICTVAIYAPGANSQDGILDPAFGNGGIVEIAWPAGAAAANAVAMDNNGNIVVGGYAAGISGDSDFALFRLLPDGSLDTSYAPDASGFRLFDFNLAGIGGKSDDSVNDLATLSDGSVVALGEAHFGYINSQFAVAKTTASGLPDPDFGDGGVAHFGFDTYFNLDQGALLKVDSSGRLVVTGNVAFNVIGTNTVDYRIGVARLSAQGQLDASFAKVYTSLWADKSTAPPTQPIINLPSAVLLDSAQRVVVAGTFYDPFPQDVGLWRTQPDGAFDPTFGPQAIARTRLQLAIGTAGDAFALDDGKLMASGTFGNAAPNTPFLMRLNEDGSTDTTFASDGLAVGPPLESNQYAAFNFLAPAKGGCWLMAGNYVDNSAPTAGVILMRFTADGKPDATFGDDGIVTIAPDSGRPFAAHRVALQVDGKLVVAGSFPASALDNTPHFAIVRLLSDCDSLFASGFEVAP